MARRLRRFLRWTTGLFTAVVVVVIAVLIFGDMSAFRDQAEAQATQILARDVRIEGDMRFLPTLPPMLELIDVRLGNPDWTIHPDLLRIKRLRLKLSTTELLTGSIKVEGVELEGFALILERSPIGDNNWSTESGEGAIPIHALTLFNGVARLVDHQHGHYPELQIKELDARLSDDHTTVEAMVAVQAHQAELSLEGGGLHSLLLQHQRWQFQATAEGDDWSLRTRGELDAEAAGQLVIEGSAAELGLFNELHGLSLPPLRPVEFKAAVSGTPSDFQVSDLLVRMGDNDVQGELMIQTSAPRISGRLKAGHLQLLDFSPPTDHASPTDSEQYLDALVPMAALAGVRANVDVSIRLDSVSHGDSAIGSGDIEIQLVDGVGTANVVASVLGGDYQAELSVDPNDDVPRLALNVGATGLDLERLPSTGEDIELRGNQVVASVELSGAGATWRTLLGSLDAEVVIEKAELVFASELLPGPHHTLKADRLRFRASDGALSQVEAAGLLGKAPLKFNFTGERPLLEVMEDGTWPLAGTLEYGDTTMRFEGQVHSPLGTPSVEGLMELSGPDTAKLASLLGFPVNQGAPFRIRTQVAGGLDAMSFVDLEATLGASDFRGEIHRELAGERARYTGTLRSRVVDSEELARLALVSDTSSPDTAHWLPPDTDLDLSLRIANLRGKLEDFSDLDLKASLQASRLHLAPFKFNFLGTPVSAELSIDERTAKPGISADIDANDLDVTATLALLREFPGWRGSTGQLEVSLRSQGRTMNEWLEHLSLDAKATDAELTYSHGSRQIHADPLALKLTSRPEEPAVLTLEGVHEEHPFALTLSVNTLEDLRTNQPVSITLASLSSDASLDVTGTIDSPLDLDGVSLRVRSQGPSLEALHPSLWLPWEQTGDFSIAADLTYSNSQLTLENIDATLGGNDVSGMIKLPFADDGQLEANLHSRVIVIADMLEPQDEQPRSADDDRYVIPSVPLAQALPTGWSGTIGWRVDRLQIADSLFERVKLDGVLGEGRLHLEHSGFTSGTGGPFSASLSIDPSPHSPANLIISAKAFDLGWMLPNDTDADVVPYWPTDLEIDLSGPAHSLPELLGSANGTIAFSGGQSEGAEFEKWELNLLSLLLPDLGPQPKVQINCMVIHADVEDGLATGDGALMETGHVIVAGGGAIDLRTERLGLVLSAKPKNSKLLGINASLEVGGYLGDAELTSVSTDVALTTGKILLGVANPFTLLGSFVPSLGGEDGTACEAALRAAEQLGSSSEAAATSKPKKGGLFGFLFSDRKRDSEPAEQAQ